MNIGECMEYAQLLRDAGTSAERSAARRELREIIAATVAAERERWAGPVRAALAAHDAGLERLGAVMRANNVQTLTLPSEAADELTAMQALRDMLRA